jgi:hypothetical protein
MTRKSFIPDPPKYPVPPRYTSEADRCNGLLANGKRCFHQVCHASSHVCRIHAMILTLNNTRIVAVNPHPMDSVPNASK